MTGGGELADRAGRAGRMVCGMQRRRAGMIICCQSVKGEAGEYWHSGAGPWPAAAVTTAAVCGDGGVRRRRAAVCGGVRWRTVACGGGGIR